MAFLIENSDVEVTLLKDLPLNMLNTLEVSRAKEYQRGEYKAIQADLHLGGPTFPWED